MKHHIILHDATGCFLLLQKSHSKHDSPHLICLDGVCCTDDRLARVIYHRITGEDTHASRDPPLLVRYAIEDDDDNDPVRANIIEAIGRRCTIPLIADYIWTSINPLLLKQMQDRYSLLVVRAISNTPTETLDNSSNDSVPWFSKRGSGKRVRETIKSRLRECGYRDIQAVQLQYSTPTSMIFRIDVGEYYLFCKISVHGRPEALFTQTLARLLPEQVLIPFRVDLNDNSFFAEDFGRTIGDVDDEDERKKLMESATNAIAQFHEKASKHVEELKRMGMEDTSPHQMRSELPRFISELRDRGILNTEEAQDMRDLLPSFVCRLDMLIDGKVPLTVCHGDLHSGNVTEPNTEGDIPLLFDWYESSISHPFLDFMLHDFAKSSWPEVYVDNWRKYDSSERLLDMLAIARELGPLWLTFQRVRSVSTRGHQLGVKQAWDFCRIQMTRLIEHFLPEKGLISSETDNSA